MKRRNGQKKAYQFAMIAKLYLAGWTQQAIAAELNIGQASVSRDLKTLSNQWIAESKVDFDSARAKELAKINRLELEYWEAWQKSTEDYKEQEIQSSEKPESKTIVKVAKTQKQNGDPRFLEGVQRCIDMRCKLLGLNKTAIDKVLDDNKDKDKPTPVIVLSGVSVDDL